MKKQHTQNRKDSFFNWRCTEIQNFGDFLWPQLNYNATTAETISVVFEQRDTINTNVGMIPKSGNIQNFIVNFTDPNSRYYLPPEQICNAFGLVLGMPLPNNWHGDTYWDYRLCTRPQNCLTADIDALEQKKDGSILAVEAAQLYDTSSINNAMRHIFRTFKCRPQQVNPNQYLAQYKYAQIFGGMSVILFHQNNPDGTIDEVNRVLTLKNDERFFQMLTQISTKYDRTDEGLFVKDFADYLQSEIVTHDNIETAYKTLLI